MQSLLRYPDMGILYCIGIQCRPYTDVSCTGHLNLIIIFSFWISRSILSIVCYKPTASLNWLFVIGYNKSYCTNLIFSSKTGFVLKPYPVQREQAVCKSMRLVCIACMEMLMPSLKYLEKAVHSVVNIQKKGMPHCLLVSEQASVYSGQIIICSFQETVQKRTQLCWLSLISLEHPGKPANWPHYNTSYLYMETIKTIFRTC